jgi:hypothetical protein
MPARHPSPAPLAALILVATLALAACGPVPSPASVQGKPVRAETTTGDRVFLLTSQWRSYKSPGSGLNRTTYTDLLIDVWGFDAATGQPVWRRRITQDRSGVNMGREILGAQDGVLWVVQPKGLVGLSTADGSVVADPARTETANPILKGVLPTEAQYYAFDAGGLRFTAADGRKWRMGPGLKAAVDTPTPDKPAPGVALPARVAGGNGTWAFMEQGLDTQALWLGLLSPEQAAALTGGGPPRGIDPTTHPRTRLWYAKIGSRRTFFGKERTYSDFKPYPDSPEFLQAGLLTDGRTNAIPILLFEPDSVLVLHRDRLGEQGRLRVSRISGPRGKVLWTVDLPMQAVEAVMPGKTSVALLGRQDDDRLKRNPNDLPGSVDQFVAIDYATGKSAGYGFLIPSTKAEEIPPSPIGAAKP